MEEGRRIAEFVASRLTQSGLGSADCNQATL
jgi:hypothetical protein